MQASSSSNLLNFNSHFNLSNLFIFDGGVSGEMPTGKQIHEHLRDLIEFGKVSRFNLQYFRIETADQLRSQLQNVCAETLQNVGIIIQLDFHGDENGIEIGNGREKISWKELMAILGKINKRSQCNLGLVLAGCNGFGSFKVEDLQEPAAFYFQLSKQGKIYPEPLRDCLKRFYETTLTQKNIAEGAKAANPLLMKYAEIMLAELLYHVCKSDSRSKIKKEYTDVVLKGLLEQSGMDGITEVGELRKIIRTHYNSYENWVRELIKSNLGFLCGRQSGYTVEELTKWIVEGETLY